MSYIVQYPATAILYLALACLGTGIAMLADRRNKPAYFVLLLAIMCTFATIRGYNVGADTSAYVGYVVTGLWPSYLEEGFTSILKVATLVGSPQFYLFVVSLITYSLFLFRFWELRKEFPLAVTVFTFICLVYFVSWNQSRFYIAVALLFFSFRYVTSGSYVRFFICCFIAFMFHTSAIMGVVFLLMRLFYIREEIAPKKKFAVVVGCLIATIVMIVVRLVFQSAAFNRYIAEYGTSLTLSQISPSMGLLIFIFLLTANMLVLLKRRGMKISPLEKSIVTLCTIGLIASIICNGNYGFYRLAQYFTVFYPLLFSMLWKYDLGNRPPIAKICVFVYTAYCLFALVNQNQHELVPYTFWFE